MSRAPFWAGKRVLVTGHTGFKGAWLSSWLRRLGAEPSGFALAPSTKPSLYADARVESVMARSTIGDLRDAAALSRAVAEARPEVIFHLAAQALVLPSYEDPVGTFATNVIGTANLLEAVRRTPGIKVVVIVTSDKCYDNREWHWGYREIDPLGGKDPYSASKGCTELVAASYRHSFFPPQAVAEHGVVLVTARAGNVIGGGDWSDHRLLPDLVRGVLAGAPVQIRHPAATRPWQHVLDPLAGYLAVAERAWTEGTAVGEAWNFGPLDEGQRNVGWMADRFAALWGIPADRVWTRDERSHPGESSLLKLDISKAMDRLGWRPRWGMETALARTVEWYRRHAEGGEAAELVSADLDYFNAG